jgi:glycosyltransferase involved in cell wall biosynthesis
MCAADVVVHTSVKPEPFGIVVLEAMALGRPLIAAAAGGPLEVVSDGEDAILIEPGDPEKLATAIRDLLANEEKRIRIGEAGAVTAAGYTPQRFAEQVTRVLDALHRQVVGT